MHPLRLGRATAWLDLCEACQLLWIEKLDQPVIDGLKARLARQAAVASLPKHEREVLAKELAEDLGEGAREMTRLEELVDLVTHFLIWLPLEAPRSAARMHGSYFQPYAGETLSSRP